MPRYPTTKIEINNEIITTRGAKYFIYKGKRYIVKDYLLNLKNKDAHNMGTDKTSKVTEVEKQSEVDKDIKEIKQSEVSGGDIFKGTNVAFDTDEGYMVLTPTKGEGNVTTRPTKHTPEPEPTATPNESNQALDLIPNKNINNALSIVTSIIPFVLMAAGFLIKDDKKESVNRGDEW